MKLYGVGVHRQAQLKYIYSLIYSTHNGEDITQKKIIIHKAQKVHQNGNHIFEYPLVNVYL
jgi:hypothetical protein